MLEGQPHFSDRGLSPVFSPADLLATFRMGNETGVVK